MSTVEQTANGVYLAYVDDYLQELGEDSKALFNAAGLSYPDYSLQSERVSVSVLSELIKTIMNQTNHPDFFLQLGARIPIIVHGNLGAALLACKDVKTLLSLVERYAAIVLPLVGISLREQGDEVIVDYHILTAFPQLNVALFEALLGHSCRNISLITGSDIYPKRVSVTWKPPSYADSYRAYTRCKVQFNAAHNQLVFSKTLLEMPIRTANAIGEKMLVEQCEDELKKLQSNTPLVDRIREIVSLYLEQSPSIGFVAKKLKISERTLRRRLNDEGLNYRDLVKEVRLQSAKYYLDKTDIRIEQIAWQLGYKETANFRKSFKEMTGLSPRQWRDKQVKSPD